MMLPAVVVVGALTPKWATVDALTVIGPLAPVSVDLAVSVWGRGGWERNGAVVALGVVCEGVRGGGREGEGGARRRRCWEVTGKVRRRGGADGGDAADAGEGAGESAGVRVRGGDRLIAGDGQ